MNADNTTLAKDEPTSGIRIGLALSGGGFRASLYHLGTIRYLEETGIMPRVEVMSTVSGGSIIGAYYLIEMDKKLRASRDPESFDRLAACDAIIDEFSQKLQLNFRMRALVFYPFFHPLLTVLRLIGLQHAGDTMAKEFEQHLFSPELRVGDLPVHTRSTKTGENDSSARELAGTRILINTTSLITGRRFVLSRESDLGLKAQIARSNPNSIPLARVVAASAAVPGLFKPLRIGNEVLADGGVVDNQGIESLLDYFAITDEELNRLPPNFRNPRDAVDPDADIYFIVSDGAGQFAVQPVSKATRAGSAGRSMSILQAANRRKVLKLLLETRKPTTEAEIINAFEQFAEKTKDDPGLQDISKRDPREAMASINRKRIAGFAFTHMAMNIKGIEHDQSERLPSEFIGATAELRTDLDVFARLERDALIFHGYTLIRNQIRRFAPILIDTSIPPKGPPAKRTGEMSFFCWPPPFVELCDPKKGSEEKARKSRFQIEQFLTVGRSAAFRDLKRFPWIFGPLLVIFLALGRLFTYVLVDQSWSQYNVRDSIRDWLEHLVVGVIPQIHIPYVIDLRGIEAAFKEGGAFAGSLDFAASVTCIALSFYVAGWLFWSVKQWFNLPARSEEKMMAELRNID